MFHWRVSHRLQVTFASVISCIRQELNIRGKKVHSCDFLSVWMFSCLSFFGSLTFGYPYLVPVAIVSSWNLLLNPADENLQAGFGSHSLTLYQIHHSATWKSFFLFFQILFNFVAVCELKTDLFCTFLETLNCLPSVQSVQATSPIFIDQEPFNIKLLEETVFRSKNGRN